MLNKDKIEKIKEIWEDYVNTDRILDVKGKVLPNIDSLRLEAITLLSDMILQFRNRELSLGEFKTSIDSFNKRNNLWGFTAIKGQFFFNQLTKIADDSNLEKLGDILIEVIAEPKDIKDALHKIEKLEKYCQEVKPKLAKVKRLSPSPKSVPYFLSYFWQVADNEKWPIYYTATIQALDKIGLWKESPIQRDNYELFFSLNEQIKIFLSDYSKRKISNWDIEHAFWHFVGNPIKKIDKTKHAITEQIRDKDEPKNIITSISANFNLSDYIIPKVSKLVELGNAVNKSATQKGYEFEKIIAEIFELLDFEVESLGQGTGRNPDAIVRFRKEDTAFLVEAKAYNGGYSLGTDDRAIREYINVHCPKLKNEGYKKIGFIIVSNEFKANFDNFVNEITWNTDIKRFILLTSEALLYLLAFKTKNKLSLTDIINCIISIGNPISAKNIIDEFGDI
ncbi:MAG: restriction endonuclease [Bacteroidales bacterium]|nr:restriction endonuclease [Bacteroidales bacterium]MCL2133845.1 restriction endonuclease [Bacteroidales bacterium]